MRTAPLPFAAFLSLALLASLCLSPLPARADLGPKPSMTFQLFPASGFIFPRDSAALTGSMQLFVCEKADCSDARLLPALGPQRLVCTAPDACRAVAYGFPPYARLRFTGKDGSSLTSNIFGKKGFRATYDVQIENNVLSVKERT